MSTSVYKEFVVSGCQDSDHLSGVLSDLGGTITSDANPVIVEIPDDQTDRFIKECRCCGWEYSPQ